ncbi:MAG: PQQ-binding-like beta-propeller repeat protein [Planctomycetota bacterium]
MRTSHPCVVFLSCVFLVALTLLVGVGAAHGDAQGDEPAADNWPMRSHDARRTGRSGNNGPRAVGDVWTYTANDGVVINIEAAVDADGVFFGTWGVMRGRGQQREKWDKFDGRIYGLDPANGRPLWEPLHPGFNPYAYRYDERAPGPQDQPAGRGLHWNFYNGTVEGTPCLDPNRSVMYVGRGDGKLYCVDRERGENRWVFTTLDPARPDDPEGGGEIVGGPLITESGLILFATWAAPHRPNPPRLVRHETNAVYAVDRRGRMRWRYPEEGTLEQVFSAPVAVSADERTCYAVTALPTRDEPCELLALDTETGELKWRLELTRWGGIDMAVGIDGVIYIAGNLEGRLGSTPIAAAVIDHGDRGEIKWGPTMLEGVRPQTHWAGGIALLEAEGKVGMLYVSTTALRDVNTQGGMLHRINPQTGETFVSWDPSEAEPACLGGLTDVTVDAGGVVYVGVRGRWQTLVSEEVPGRMYALIPRDDRFDVLWSYEVAGQIDWASPAIGPDGGLYFGSSDSLRGLGFLVTRQPHEDVADADPVFYGIHE